MLGISPENDFEKQEITSAIEGDLESERQHRDPS